MIFMNGDFPVLTKFDGDIVVMQHVVIKIFLNYLSLVSQAKNELIKTVVSVELHDMPEDRFCANFHHGLGAKLCFLTHAGAHATAKNNYLHKGYLLGRVEFVIKRTFLFFGFLGIHAKGIFTLIVTGRVR
jgi:hypothetical protein